MASFDSLLAGNPTAAGQGFRAPGFDALTSFQRALEGGSALNPGGTDLQALAGVSFLNPVGEGLVGFEEIMQALGLSQPQAQQAPAGMEGLIGLLLRGVMQLGAEGANRGK